MLEEKAGEAPPSLPPPEGPTVVAFGRRDSGKGDQTGGQQPLTITAGNPLFPEGAQGVAQGIGSWLLVTGTDSTRACSPSSHPASVDSVSAGSAEGKAFPFPGRQTTSDSNCPAEDVLL